jgi:hypothetical protein
VGSALVLAVRAYYFHDADERVRAAEAKLDQKDPRWRWEDILADRAAVPDEENSARPILAAAELLPKDWPKKPPEERPPGTLPGPDDYKDLVERAIDAPPNQRLAEKLAADARAELKAVAPALAAAQPVTRLPRGRYEVVWSRDIIGTPVDHDQRARRVANLFALQAVFRAEEGDLSHALVSVRGALNTARSTGDEPTLISLLVRIASGNMALRALQRVLAQGEPSLHDLEEMQRQLRRETKDTEPLLRHRLRAERAAFFELTGRFASGEFGWRYLDALVTAMSDSWKPYSAEETWWSSFPSWLILRPMARYNQAAILDLMTELVEIAELPPWEQAEAFAEFRARMDQLKPSARHLFMAMLFLPAADKVASAFHRYRAGLECAQAALAAERFRREQKRWPDSLAELVPKYLGRVPEDAFDGKPLRFRRTEEGVEIFSVGPDNLEEPRVLDPGGKKGTAVGFRLWDTTLRRR